MLSLSLYLCHQEASFRAVRRGGKGQSKTPSNWIDIRHLNAILGSPKKPSTQNSYEFDSIPDADESYMISNDLEDEARLAYD